MERRDWANGNASAAACNQLTLDLLCRADLPLGALISGVRLES